MTTHRSHSRVLWALSIALISLTCQVEAATAGKLTEGVALPLLESETLGHDAVTLPRDAHGHGTVLVIGFSKAAAEITRTWMNGCRTAAAGAAGSGAGAGPEKPNTSCYDVRMLENVPRLFRGMMERGMRNGLPAEFLPFTLLVYKANDLWRELLGAADDKTAYVIGCDGEGRVQGIATGPFVESELKRLLAAIAPKPGK